MSWSDVRLEWLPYTLEIPEFLGTVEGLISGAASVTATWMRAAWPIAPA